jgi:hypothetical protein
MNRLQAAVVATLPMTVAMSLLIHVGLFADRFGQRGGPPQDLTLSHGSRLILSCPFRLTPLQ